VVTGGCPHAAIREDISANMHALEELQGIYQTELLFVESGGDNLAGESLAAERSACCNLSIRFALFSKLLEGIGGLHHLCCECTDILSALTWLQS